VPYGIVVLSEQRRIWRWGRVVGAAVLMDARPAIAMDPQKRELRLFISLTFLLEFRYLGNVPTVLFVSNEISA
jgi:hypothetical protein